MKQRNRKLACLCITAALLAGANTMTAAARQSEDQVVIEEKENIHTAGISLVSQQAAEAVLAAETNLQEEHEDTDKGQMEAEQPDFPEGEQTEPELAVSQADTYANIRSIPSMEGEILGKLYKNAVGEIIEKEEGWLKIRSGTVEGYVCADYVAYGEEGKAKAEEVGMKQATVHAVTLRLREEASTESQTLSLLPQEEVLTVRMDAECDAVPAESTDAEENQAEKSLAGENQEEENPDTANPEMEWIAVTNGVHNGYVAAEYVELSVQYEVAESREEEAARLQREEEERQEAERARQEQLAIEQRAKEAEEAAKAQRQQAASSSGGQTSAASGAVAQNRTTTQNQAPAQTQSVPQTGGTTGRKIADYALQFVGNPYVYGGTSLTNGADCSGFVMSVYKNFGISLPRTSGEQGKCGTDVGGIANAQPGDLVAYSGHIGIYIGNGQIVHASSAKTGIKVSNASYRSILSVRRIV